MQDEQMFLSVVRMWAAAAWADGVIADNERTLLEGLIRGADVSEGTRTTALGFLETKVDIASEDAASLGPRERQGVYRAACKMTTVDRDVHETERIFLKRLSTLLDLDEAVAVEIEKKMGIRI